MLSLPENSDVVEQWVPAFPTELVRGLKATGRREIV